MSILNEQLDFIVPTINELNSQLKNANYVLALFSHDKILYSNTFGFLDKRKSIPTDEKTLFSIQSISKLVTSTLTLLAVQEGHIKFDEPIVEYLPNFRINSVYEDQPELKITIRHLLGNTSGLEHEAPIGNNFFPTNGSRDEHLNSIRATYLKFPVGSNYSYSNLGFDLVTEIVEQVTGKKYEEYIEETLFKPLGMHSTTVDPDIILLKTNRSRGRTFGLKDLPPICPMTGAGGVYSNLEDFIKLIQLHLALGKRDGRQFIREELLQEMYSPLSAKDYALGVSIIEEKESFAFNHNGLGFGFNCSVKWFPEYDIGCFILSNFTGSNLLLYQTISNILSKYIEHKNTKTSHFFNDFNPMSKFIYSNNKVEDTGFQFEHKYDSHKRLSDWNKIKGVYVHKLGREYQLLWFAKIARKLGFKIPKIEVHITDVQLILRQFDGVTYQKDKLLYEIEPKLFLTRDGEVLDFRNDLSYFRNIELQKIK